jgi:aquaporin Z
MSINPARTAASALSSGIWTTGWIYFTAPVLGMLLAAELYRSVSNSSPRACPKLLQPARRTLVRIHSGGATD